MRTVACDILSFNEFIEEYNMKFAKVIAFVSLACLMASAQEKTAFVNMEKIFEEYYKTVNANIIFEQQKQNFDEHLELIRDEVDAVAKELGGKIAIARFVRFEKGEGIEKRTDDLAAEVAKMVGGN